MQIQQMCANYPPPGTSAAQCIRPGSPMKPYPASIVNSIVGANFGGWRYRVRRLNLASWQTAFRHYLTL